MNKTKGLIFTASLVLATTFTISCEDKEDKNKFTDSRDGKTYKKVTIGSQTWMAENLNFAAEGSKCGDENNRLADNNTAYCDEYGRLYDWNTAMKACPSGWHLPSDNEWTELMNFLVSNKEEVRYEEYEETGEKFCSNAGKYLKSKSGWRSDRNGTDEFGFSALPGGDGYSHGQFSSVGDDGNWWSAYDYEGHSNYACIWTIHNDNNIRWGNMYKSSLNSIRCIQN